MFDVGPLCYIYVGLVRSRFDGCVMLVCGDQVDTEGHVDVHVALDAVDGLDQTAGNVEYAATCLRLAAFKAYHTGEASNGQGLVDLYTGDACMPNEDFVRQGRAHTETHRLHGIAFVFAVAEACDGPGRAFGKNFF